MARKLRPTASEQPLHTDDQPATRTDREQLQLDLGQTPDRPVQDKPPAAKLLRGQDLIATLRVSDLMRAAATVRLTPRALAQALVKAQVIHQDDFARLPWPAE